MVQRVLIDEAIEVLFQFAGHFGRATGAGPIEPWGPSCSITHLRAE